MKILKFSAEWCAPCKVFHKTFEEVSKMEEFKDIEFEELDVEDDVLKTEKYGIMSVPTTIILGENDEVVFKVIGNVPKTDLINSIKRAM